MLGNFMAIWSILLPFDIFCVHFGIFCVHLGIFYVIWYIFSVLVCCTKKKLAILMM
jgi:hypothetical protein